MREINGNKCLTEKEVSNLYGYSQSWFSRKRVEKSGPPFIKLKTGRIYYPAIEVDIWFRNQIELNTFD